MVTEQSWEDWGSLHFGAESKLDRSSELEYREVGNLSNQTNSVQTLRKYK
jgi:hypothetical protein